MAFSDPSDDGKQTSSIIAPILSALVPGLGQVIRKRRTRGLVIFLTVLLLAFLVNWAMVNYKIGLIAIGSFTTSWLWVPLAIFWVWNVLDVVSIGSHKPTQVLIGLVFALVILYVIAWNVTDVKLDRLVTRFEDARRAATALVNPDFFSVDVNGEVQTCSWSCLWTNLVNKVKGLPTQAIRVSDNAGDILGKYAPNAIPDAQGNIITTFQPGTMIATIAIGIWATLFSTILAVPLSFLAAHNIMARGCSNVVYYVMRAFLNIVRAVDTLVWGLVVIVWVGLGSFAGVIALTVHSMAALGKLFSEEIEHIDPGPVEALTATGANLFQVIRYGVIPQVIPSFLAYTLLRWDINMRSATIVGIVAGGGIGVFVLQAIRMGAYQQYAAALWIVAVVIILVDYISARWRESILRDQPQVKSKPTRLNRILRVSYIVLGIVLFVYLWTVTAEINLSTASFPGILIEAFKPIKDMFNPGPTFGRLVLDFLKVDLTQPVVTTVVNQILITILQALLATTLGAIVALPFSFLAAKNLVGKNRFLSWLYYITRSVFNILRSIEALLYAGIFVFWVGIGPFAGMMALAVTTFALIGKLFSEAIENIDPGPIEAVNATGANRLQMIAYAILPQIVPPFASYLIYQWDINIRMATIIGFAGGGGIGLTLSTFFGSLQYHKAGTVIAAIVIVVALMDFASAKIREKLV
jgi:phosphonate ABC transporter permease subunit PhnE